MIINLFFSHYNEDKDIVAILSKLFKEVSLGIIQPWDSSLLEPGQVWLDQIRNNLQSCEAVIVLLTPKSINSRWLNFESGIGEGLPMCEVIPIGIGLKSYEEIPYPLAMYQASLIRTYDEFIIFISKLLLKFKFKFEKSKFEKELIEAYSELTRLFQGPSIINDRRNMLIQQINEINDSEILNSFLKIATNLKRVEKHPILFSLLRKELNLIDNKFLSFDTQSNYPNWAQSSNNYVNQLFCDLISSLPNESRYDTVTHFGFWSLNTLSNPHEFISHNSAYAHREDNSITIRRCFLIEKQYSELDDFEKKIMKYHLEATSQSNGLIQTKILAKFSKLENFAICIPREGPKLLLVMRYEEESNSGKLQYIGTELRLKDSDIITFCSNFESKFKRAIDIDEYCSS